MEVSVNTSDGFIRQRGNNIGQLDGCVNYTADDATSTAIAEQARDRFAQVFITGITTHDDGTISGTVTSLPTPIPTAPVDKDQRLTDALASIPTSDPGYTVAQAIIEALK